MRNNGSVYVKGEKSVIFEKGILESDFPSIFDYDAGLKLEVTKIEAQTSKEKAEPDVDKKEKVGSQKAETRLIDDWA